jgi:DNA primase
VISARSYLALDGQYDEYRRRLDARKVLQHYGMENDHDEVTPTGDTEVIHSCLLDRVDRHHNNGDAHPSASCNLDKKLYICYSYWGGDLFHLIQKMENRNSFAEIVPFLAQFLGDATAEPDEFRKEMEPLLAALLSRPGAYAANLPSYSDRVLAPWALIHPYLHERGIDSDTASRLKIGWREDDNRIIIPHFWDGKLVGWQARAVPPRPGQWPGTAQPQPKYRSTPGFPKSDTLYHDHSRPRPTGGSVVVVESPFSVIKATALGLDTPVLATFGAKVSGTQIKMLADYDQVTIWADPDAAGYLMQRRLAEALHRNTRVRVVQPDEGQDLADCETLDYVKEKMESAVPAVTVLTQR